MAYPARESPASAGHDVVVQPFVDEDSALQQLGQGGFIQFQPALAERLGFKAALFLGHALYWSRHLARKNSQRSGWIYMTARQWEDATGLTAREQGSVRQLLQENQLLLERVTGRPARLHYRVDLARLAQWSGLQAHADGEPAITWEAFAPWLKTSVSFYRPLARVCDSVASGLLLSYLLRQQRAAIRSGEATFEGYFRLSQEDVRNALCLGTKTQRNARERIKALGFLHERAGGLCQVNLHALQDALGHIEKLPQPSRLHVVAAQTIAPPVEGLAEAVRWLTDAHRRPSTDPVLHEQRVQEQLQLDLFGRWLKDAPQGQQATQSVTRMFASTSSDSVPVIGLFPGHQDPAGGTETGCQPSALLSNQVPDDHTTKGQAPAVLSDQVCRFVESTLPFCRSHIQQQNNPTTTTIAHASEDAARFNKTAGRSRRNSEFSPSEARLVQETRPVAPIPTAPGDLDSPIMPKALALEWHDGVRRTLANAPTAIHQALLDELQGQLGMQGKTIHNPPGYLHALIRRHASGSLELAMADKVAADRAERARTELAVRRARQESEQRQPAADSPAQAVPKPEPSSSAMEARRKLLTLRHEMAGKRGGK